MKREINSYCFTFRLTPSNPNITNVQNKETFWSFFFEHFLRDEHQNNISLKSLELRLQRRCGKILKEKLVEHQQISHQRTQIFSVDNINIFFEVKSITYSSIALTFAITGLESLIKLFSSNFSSFEAFLNLYTLDAFVESLPYNIFRTGRNSDFALEDEICEYFNWEININDEIQKAFGNIDKDKNDQKNQALTTALLKANLPSVTLLIPVILALLILGFEILSLKEEKYEFQKMRTEQQEEWRKLYLQSQKEIKELKESIKNKNQE